MVDVGELQQLEELGPGDIFKNCMCFLVGDKKLECALIFIFFCLYGHRIPMPAN